jgi:hypothetical protein
MEVSWVRGAGKEGSVVMASGELANITTSGLSFVGGEEVCLLEEEDAWREGGKYFMEVSKVGEKRLDVESGDGEGGGKERAGGVMRRA